MVILPLWIIVAKASMNGVGETFLSQSSNSLPNPKELLPGLLLCRIVLGCIPAFIRKSMSKKKSKLSPSWWDLLEHCLFNNHLQEVYACPFVRHSHAHVCRAGTQAHRQMNFNINGCLQMASLRHRTCDWNWYQAITRNWQTWKELLA